MKQPLRTLSLAALLLLGATRAASAQENLELGKMWTFENPPLAYLEEEYGFAPDQKWLDSLRLASLRFGSWCSASFVSPKGLIMTNHHCVRDNVAKVSPPGEDWVENGFYARSRDDEVELKGLTVQQLVSMEDVTAAMNEGVAEGDDDAAIAKKRAANEKKILDAASEAEPGLEPQVVKLHNGAAWQLYRYKVWDDIRLVCAPHLQTAHFGGDPDNFTYPRYSIDFAFCRAYEDGEPADTRDHYFRWKAGGPKDGELVFVTGNPGSTGRLLTVAQLEYLRDAEHPISLEQIDSQLEILRRFAERSPQLEKLLRQSILGLENSQKAMRGYQRGVLDEKLMARKREAEAAFRAKVEADPELRGEYGDVWERLAEIAARKTALEAKLRFQVPSYSAELGRALSIVRAVDTELPEKEREQAREQALQPLRTSAIYLTLFIDHLQRAVERLGRDDPYVRAVVGDGDPRAAAIRFARSDVRDRDFVEELLDGGAAAVAASRDPAIVAARGIRPLIDANQELADELSAEEEVQGARLGRAVYAVYGDDVSPDATMTLRFSDGVVKGYPYNGTIAPHRTCFYGLYARNCEFGGEFPFSLPEIWHERKDRIDMTKGVDFVSTNDIIGGNSGSPVVDRELRVVGLIFDGNIEQLPNKFLYRDEVARSISVHVDAIMEALTEIYDAPPLARELLGEKAEGEQSR